MIEVIRKPWRRLSQRYQKSALAQFLRWWRDELLGLLPAGWRERFRPDATWLTVRARPDGWALTRSTGGRVESSLDVEAPREALLEGLARLRGESEQEPRQILLLPGEQVLRRKLTLPAAAEDHLEQVLSFEMDRHTPFRVDQLYTDHRISKRDGQSRQIVVDLVAVPKPQLDQVLQPLAGIPMDAVDLDFDGIPGGFNLLPVERRARRVNQRLRINLILAVSVVALLGLVMWQSLRLREGAVEQLTEAVSVVRDQAAVSAEMKRQLRDAIEGANFLAKRKTEQPPTVDVMLELTQLIPDDTWLERVSFVGPQVQIAGQSARADKLIAILQKSKYLTNPQFQGIIQPDAATGKERFTLAADLITGAPKHGSDTAAGSR